MLYHHSISDVSESVSFRWKVYYSAFRKLFELGILHLRNDSDYTFLNVILKRLQFFLIWASAFNQKILSEHLYNCNKIMRLPFITPNILSHVHMWSLSVTNIYLLKFSKNDATFLLHGQTIYRSQNEQVILAGFSH